MSSKCPVAYLGPPSTYSHQAALEYFDQEKYTLIPQRTIQDIFEAVQSSRVTYGVVPFENSTNGPVVFTLDLLADRQHLFPNVCVCGETYLAIHHYLLGLTRTTEGSGSITPTAHSSSSSTRSAKQQQTSLDRIERIYSHPQAFGQCEKFISAHLPNAERCEVSSTSKAAEIVAKNSSELSAAIASRVAADVHSLDILASKIEDREDNTTRFLILKNTLPDGKDLNGEHGTWLEDSEAESIERPVFLR